MVDILIQNGQIVDGTGNPWFYGDVAILDGCICDIGFLGNLPAKEVIDAKDKIICPGFIDIHAHADIALLARPRHEPKIMQGVTTDVFSNCGLGFAPVTKDALETLRDVYGAIFGDNTGVTWDWTSVADYLSRFEKGIAANFAYIIPHIAPRVSVMGMDERPATKDELARMCELVRQGMEEGAFGMSDGLWYAPICYADLEESIELCKVVAEYGGIYTIHMRDYRDEIDESIAEVLRIAEESGVPVQIGHLAAVGPDNKGRSKDYLRTIEDARTRGIDITCDSYPYLAGSTLLQAMLPKWASAGASNAILGRLRDEQTRTKIIEELSEPQWDWTKAFICSVKTDANKKYEGVSFADIATERNVMPVQLICDLLLEEELEISFLIHTGHEADVQNIMSHPAQMIGSDGLHLSGKMHPRLYGTFARYPGRYVRELNVLTLEQAIRKMTSLPAQRVGLKDRGILKVNTAADVVVFDPDRVRDLATYDEPTQYPEGIPHVIVNGVIVKRDDEHTGALPGQVLRKTGSEKPVISGAI